MCFFLLPLGGHVPHQIPPFWGQKLGPTDTQCICKPEKVNLNAALWNFLGSSQILPHISYHFYLSSTWRCGTIWLLNGESYHFFSGKHVQGCRFVSPSPVHKKTLTWTQITQDDHHKRWTSWFQFRSALIQVQNIITLIMVLVNKYHLQ